MNQIILSYEDLKSGIKRALLHAGLPSPRAGRCAEVFADNTRDGSTHGIQRLPSLIRAIQSGRVDPAAEPDPVVRMGAFEQWDGHYGPGVLNALKATERAIELAGQQGLGCVAMRNTMHWMRAGYYGQKAAEAGFAFICWTNTLPLVVPWGGTTSTLGNNPLVFAMPGKEGPVVLDMAIAQYSMGQLARMRDELPGKQLEVDGGYDKEGRPSRDPSAILDSMKSIPMGFWKGTGLALMLDLFASVLSTGRATHELDIAEIGVSQVFIAFDLSVAGDPEAVKDHVNRILNHYRKSVPANPDHPVRFPGERVIKTRRKHDEEGIPVDRELWGKIGADF